MGNTIVLENEDYISSNISLLKDNLTYISSKQHQYFGQIQIWKNKTYPQEWIFSKVHSAINQNRLLKSIFIKIKEINETRKFIKILWLYNRFLNEITYNQKNNITRIPIQIIALKSKHFKEQLKNIEFIMNFNQSLYQRFFKITNRMVNMLQSHLYGNQLHKFRLFLVIQRVRISFTKISPWIASFLTKKRMQKFWYYLFQTQYHGALPNILSAYAQTLGNYNSNISLTPQQMKDYQNHLACLQINPFKQDSYQFGIVLVSIMSGKDVTKCTDFYKEVIHYQQILNILGSAFHYYSQNLINLVVSLLQYDDLQRPNISQLFKAKIYKKLPFLNQTQLKKYKQPEKKTIKRVDTNNSYSFQKERINSINNILTETNKVTRSITTNTILYSSPVKFSTRTSTAYPKKFSFVEGYFTPKNKQSRTISYRFFTSNIPSLKEYISNKQKSYYKKVQSPYIY